MARWVRDRTVEPVGDFHGTSMCFMRLAACQTVVRASLRTLCRVPSDAGMRADVIAPCPPTDGAAVLSIDTDSISHSANRETERSPFSIWPVEFRRDRCTPVPGAGIEPAASTFRAWRHDQQQLPRSRRFGKEDSNLHHLIQSQGACRLADSRERPAGVEPACRTWEARAWPLGPGRCDHLSAGSGIRTPVAWLEARSRAAGPIPPRSSRESSGRRGSRTPKAYRSPEFESGAVASRLALP